MYFSVNTSCGKMKKQAVVIRFRDRLGNQMFQYAFYKKIKNIRSKAVADLSWYNGQDVKFCLQEAFPTLRLQFDKNNEMFEMYCQTQKNRTIFQRILYKLFPLLNFYIEEMENGIYYPEVLKYRRGVLDGYWQTSKYWEDIKDDVVRDFTFAEIYTPQTSLLHETIRQYNTVSVHIRREDYLWPRFKVTYRGICTLEYYKKAIAYMKTKVENVKFLFFSDDPEWVKKHFNFEDAIFATDYLNEEIPDWYHMYMMSRCNHHIIANSTFSWWGAYLGKNENKIVIAPAKWMNGFNTKDIYEENWIKM